MTLPGFPSRIVLWPWSVTPGIANSKTFTFLDGEGGDYDPGTVTAKAKDGTISATVTGSGNTRTVTWSAEQTALIPATQWRLNFGGEDQLGGRIGISQPELAPDSSDEWTIQLPGDGGSDGLTITVAGAAHATAWTALLPASLDGVAGWIDPLDLVGSSNPAYIPRGLSVRLLADGRVQLEGLALYVDSSGSPDVPPAASTIATLASGFHPLTRPPFVTAFETSFGDGSLSQASASVSLTGEVKAPQSPTSPLLAITSTYDPA